MVEHLPMFRRVGLFVFLVPRDVRDDQRRTAVNLKRSLIMLTTFGNTLTPIFGDYIYVGGGLLTLVVIVVLVLFVVRRL